MYVFSTKLAQHDGYVAEGIAQCELIKSHAYGGLCCVICRAIFIFMLALVGVFYPYNRGALYTALVMIYALTSGIAGYTAASFYKQLEGVNWVSE